MVYRSLNGLVPEYLSSNFTKRNLARYSLREYENKLIVPFLWTNKNNFSYSGATLLKRLPCKLRKAISLKKKNNKEIKRLLNPEFIN